MHKIGIAGSTYLKSGKGLPLTQFDNAHVPTLTADLLYVLVNRLIIGAIAPAFKIKSL